MYGGKEMSDLDSVRLNLGGVVLIWKICKTSMNLE